MPLHLRRSTFSRISFVRFARHVVSSALSSVAYFLPLFRRRRSRFFFSLPFLYRRCRVCFGHHLPIAHKHTLACIHSHLTIFKAKRKQRKIKKRRKNMRSNIEAKRKRNSTKGIYVRVAEAAKIAKTNRKKRTKKICVEWTVQINERAKRVCEV